MNKFELNEKYSYAVLNKQNLLCDYTEEEFSKDVESVYHEAANHPKWNTLIRMSWDKAMKEHTIGDEILLYRVLENIQHYLPLIEK